MLMRAVLSQLTEIRASQLAVEVTRITYWMYSPHSLVVGKSFRLRGLDNPPELVYCL